MSGQEEAVAVIREALNHWGVDGFNDHLMPAYDALDSLAAALAQARLERDAYKARYDSYAPGTVEGQVRAMWDLAEHHGHPVFSSEPAAYFLEKKLAQARQVEEAARLMRPMAASARCYGRPDRKDEPDPGPCGKCAACLAREGNEKLRAALSPAPQADEETG